MKRNSRISHPISQRIRLQYNQKVMKAWKILIPAAVLCLLIPVFHRIHMERMEAQKLAERIREENAYLEERTAVAEKRIAEVNSAFYTESRMEARKEKDPSFRRLAAGIDTMPVCLIGDSVMLGAAENLREAFPAGIVDAEENRSYYPVFGILESLLEEGREFNPVVFGIGTNAPLSKSACEEIIRMCGERQLFWLTTTNNWQFYNTDTIRELEEEFDQLEIIDWEAFSSGHPEYFYEDGIHLPPAGRKAYTDLIVTAIEDRALSMRPKKRKDLLIGDDCLLACISELSLNKDCMIMAEEDLSTERIMEKIASLKEEDILPDHITLIFHAEEADRLVPLSNLLENPDCRVVFVEKNSNEPPDMNAQIIRYGSTLQDWLYDEHHLSSLGCRNLSHWLSETLLSQDQPE